MTWRSQAIADSWRPSRRGLLGLAAGAVAAWRGPAAWAAQVATPVDDGTWSTNPLWPVLKKTHLITDANGLIRASFTPEVEALASKPMTISGFILPVETSTRYKHFILSRYSPECPFCPSGGPTEVIEVFSAKPVGPTPAMVTMRGVFAIQGNMEAGLFYRMDKTELA